MVPAFAGARASKKMNLERQSLDVAEVQPGPSWAPRNWPILDSDDLTAALDPQQMQVAVKAAAAKAAAPLSTAEVERAADDANRAMMLIRTYDRKRVAKGTSVSVRVVIGGCQNIKKKK